MNGLIKQRLAKSLIILAVLLLAIVLVWKSLLPPKPGLYHTGRFALLVSPFQQPASESLYIGDLATNQVKFLFETRANGSELFWSPDGRRLIVSGSFPTGLYALIGDVTDGKAAEIKGGIYAWGGFAGWTSDGHYAIFTSDDQYGNSDTTVFDTWQWQMVITTTATKDACFEFHSMGGGCYRRVSAVSPVSPALVLMDGTLIDISHLTETSVISRSIVKAATWSPDGQYLAFIRLQVYPRECSLYLAKGDGARSRPLARVPCDYTLLEWKYDAAVLWTETEKFILDPVKQQISTFSVASWETPQPKCKEPCGNLFPFLRESPSSEITSACRSPDKALLAIGKSGMLQIFDANLNLLQTFAVPGTVMQIAWSPTP